MSSDTVDPKLLEVLRCPLTGQALRLASDRELHVFSSGEASALIREDGQVIYPVRNGIPLLLPGAAVFRGA